MKILLITGVKFQLQNDVDHMNLCFQLVFARRYLIFSHSQIGLNLKTPNKFVETTFYKYLYFRENKS